MNPYEASTAQSQEQLRQIAEDQRRQQELAARQQEEIRRQQEMMRQTQAQQGGDMGPITSSMGVGNFQSIFGGGAGAGSTTGAGASGASGAASSGGLGSLAGMWPAAVVVAAVANESYAKDKGYRRGGLDYIKDLGLGRVLYQDIDQRWAPKLTGKSDKLGIGGDMRAGAALGSLQPKKAIDHLKNDSSIGKLLKKIF